MEPRTKTDKPLYPLCRSPVVHAKLSTDYKGNNLWWNWLNGQHPGWWIIGHLRIDDDHMWYGPPKLYKVYQNKKEEYYIHLKGKRFYFFKPVGKGTWTMRD